MILTFGHGTASQEEIVELLRAAGVAFLVDVRTAPGSRRNPHVMRGELEQWLPRHGIGYRWDKRLGGFRRAPQDSPDVFWNEEMFRGYAAHMRTEEFATAVDELVAEAGDHDGHTCVMCSESVWWRCHRRLLADYLVLVRGEEVRHLMHDGRVLPHRPAEGARRTGAVLVYDGGQQTLA